MKKLLIISVCFLLIATPVFLYFFYQEQSISCTNSITLVKEGGKLSLTTGQKMSKGKGMVTLVGTLYRKDGSRAHISRKVLFDYHYRYDFMIAKSMSVNVLSQNNVSNEETKQWISEFFIKPGAEISLVFNRVGLNTWLIFTTPVPLSLCEK
ncbi:hypothetical protein F3J28_12870 [Enterobacter sp. Ap-1006]|uniref:hypothetical protein n=1 Tax=Enterobacter sp. Ap-1006 TaxID=2608345 RepID=UPI0014204CA2|nr:hypothetical protein [Enterobacter sp. Ap-1006]NIF48656.1 hypothetical protein [Enterobacter sp. Ap-1006]